MSRMTLVNWSASACLVLTALTVEAQAPDDRVAWSDLQPIVSERCAMCHTGEFAPLGLRLESLDGLLAGSQNGPVVISGEPETSELIRRIRGDSQPRMPMTGPPFLSDEEVALFETWIAGGLRQSMDTSARVSAGSGSAPEADRAPPSEPLTTAASAPVGDEPVTWQHVAPIFATRCAKCHTDQGLMGPAPEGYRLTSYESTLSPADRARVIAGNPDASELVRRIRGQSLPRMPFDGPPYLSEDEIALIEEWVAAGAPDATGEAASVPTGAEVRLHGVLGQGWTLDGLQLVVPPGTRTDDNPRPGDYVQVRAVIDHRGRIRAERIRVRD